MSRFCKPLGLAALLLGGVVEAAPPARDGTPLFRRHMSAVFSRLGCNAGACHGAVKGQGGFRLTLFAADAALDHERVLREFNGRRVNVADPDASLLLLKATGRVAHQGGKRLDAGWPEYEVLRKWIAGGGKLDPAEPSRVRSFRVTPSERVARPGESYPLRVEATFADGSVEDVTKLCSFDSLDKQVAIVERDGLVRAVGPGDTALVLRYRAEPVLAMVVVPQTPREAFPQVTPHNFIDKHVLAKLRRLNVPPADLADDATFLRRASLDVTGALPSPREIRAFLADTSADKRDRKIEELLGRPGYAALWTLKFCDLLKASDFGVYADGLTQEIDAPRFQAWVRARLEENIPYDQFAQRILTATSREGRSLEDWAKEVIAMADGYGTPRGDIVLYQKRKTLDLYWQRRNAASVPGALQIAHTFLGLRLECAQCHRHPHDVWQQADLLSFANFFMHVREAGFQGDNEKKFADVAAYTKKLSAEMKTLADQAKKLHEGKGKKLDGEAKKAKSEADKLLCEAATLEQQAAQKKDQPEEAERLRKQAADKRKQAEPLQALQAEYARFQNEIAQMERRSRYLDEVQRRLLHAEIHYLENKDVFARVTSPLGTQTSKTFRLLGEAKALDVPKGKDPRELLAEWLRRPDNPYFAKAIVNRVWAHYFGRGIVDPPDNLSSFNPPSHPELLRELCQEFIRHGYDLKWLHRVILRSRTYQQSSTASAANRRDRSNYAYFHYRRLQAEVLLDALNQTTGTTENMDMRYYHWPEQIKTIEIPYAPRNSFVTFMLEQFGKPARNAAVQCDCERDANASILQVMSFANHPRTWQKISDDKGLIARIVKEIANEDARIEEVFLSALSRLPTDAERQACLKYLRESTSPSKGLQGILWSLLNTREFLVQH
jgi:hypothetical protein